MYQGGYRPLGGAAVILSSSPISGGSPCLAVPWVRGVHGSRFIATCQAWPGLLVGSAGVSTWWCGPGCSGARDRREGGEVACGVDVPVEDQAAVLAGEDPDAEGQLGFHCLAGRAGLAAGGPPVGDDQAAAVPPGLVVELPPDFAEGGAGQMPGPLRVAQHPADVEVLDHDRPVGAGEGGGEFAERVGAQAGGPGT